MPERKRIVINTSPLISLVAALGDLSVLDFLYEEVIGTADFKSAACDDRISRC